MESRTDTVLEYTFDLSIVHIGHWKRCRRCEFLNETQLAGVMPGECKGRGSSQWERDGAFELRSRLGSVPFLSRLRQERERERERDALLARNALAKTRHF